MEEENLKKIESKLWASAEKMRGAVSVSDYKFIVLGLIFLKYISDSFEEKYNAIFAPPQFSADNSAGIAYLGYRKYNDVHTRV